MGQEAYGRKTFWARVRILAKREGPGRLAKMKRWWMGAAAVLALDQGLKLWATRALQPGEVWPMGGRFFRLTRVHNSGAAFGLFPEGTLAFLVTSAVVASLLFAYLLWRRPQGLKAWASALILGGALGNLIDRARLGYVLDLFALGNFPVFNVADAALVLGVGILALGILRGQK